MSNANKGQVSSIKEMNWVKDNSYWDPAADLEMELEVMKTPVKWKAKTHLNWATTNIQEAVVAKPRMPIFLFF